MRSGPQRTCVVCRAVRMKHELVRLVRSPDGVVAVDEHGRAPGRGAYVCRGGECAARLAKGGRLSQAFRRPTRVEPTMPAAVHAVGRSEERDVSRDRTMGETLMSSGR